MPSARRLRLLLIGVVAVVVMTLVFTSRLRNADGQDGRTIGDFYHRTAEALERAHNGQQKQTVLDANTGRTKADGERGEDEVQLAKDMQARLRAAEQKAKDSANAKILKPEKPEQVIGVGSSAGGQNKATKDKSADKDTEEETEEDHEVESAINDILKKSPVIIFSKTTCPFSKRAKALLLEEYQLDPEPFVVELNIHPLGSKIQDRLATMTGRKTVPNIMVNGKSIGGADELVELHKRKVLADKIQLLGSVGGKEITVKLRSVKPAI